MTRSYYCYQFSFKDGDSTDVYIGQAKSRTRALTHLAASHSEKVRQRMHDAAVWPLISVFPLPHPCSGDLSVMEAVLIEDAKDRARGNGRLAPISETLNSRTEAGVQWAKPDADMTEEECSEPLGELIPDGDGEWRMHTWPLCNEKNEDAIIKALDESRRISDERPLPEGPQGFALLPKPGSPIERVNFDDLRKRLNSVDVGTAIVVSISTKKLMDGRDSLGYDSSEDSLRDRIVQYWPLTIPLARKYREKPPTAVIGVFGEPGFRLILGAWRVEPNPDSLDTGIWIPKGLLEGFAGLVLEPSIKFNQSAHPVWLLDSSGSTVQSQAQSTREAVSATK